MLSLRTGSKKQDWSSILLVSGAKHETDTEEIDTAEVEAEIDLGESNIQPFRWLKMVAESRRPVAILTFHNGESPSSPR